MNLHDIATATADHYGVDLETMRGYSRLPEHVRPRQVFCYLADRWSGESTTQIGRVIRRDHTTVLHSIRKAEAFRDRSDIEAIERVACFDWSSIPFKSQRA